MTKPILWCYTDINLVHINLVKISVVMSMFQNIMCNGVLSTNRFMRLSCRATCAANLLFCRCQLILFLLCFHLLPYPLLFLLSFSLCSSLSSLCVRTESSNGLPFLFYSDSRFSQPPPEICELWAPQLGRSVKKLNHLD